MFDTVCQQQTGTSTEKVCCVQIDSLPAVADHAAMAKRKQKSKKYRTINESRGRPPEDEIDEDVELDEDDGPLEFAEPIKLYLGQWIARLDRERDWVCRRGGIKKSYLSQIISGKKKNPNHVILYRISEALGITVNDLYRLPPPKPVLDVILRVRDDHAARVGGQLLGVRPAG